MIKIFTDRLNREDRGFTLIELMVVVLIIAILIAIAIPTFLGARRRAQDRAAQSSDRNALTAAKAIFTDRENYFDVMDGTDPSAELEEGEPSLTFVPSNEDSSGPNEVSVFAEAVGEGQPNDVANRFVAAALSASGVCWFVQDIVGPVGTANTGTTWSRNDDGGTAGNCQAGTALPFADPGWGDSPGNAGAAGEEAGDGDGG